LNLYYILDISFDDKYRSTLRVESKWFKHEDLIIE